MATGITSAEARPSVVGNDSQWSDSDGDWSGERRSTRRGHYRGRRTARVERRHSRRSGTYRESSNHHGVGGRPRQWCGWWMRTQRGGGPELNLAWNWSRWGRPSGPQVGAVVVWRHHVGEIVGRASNGQWIVRSGNDGGAVRTRVRSVAGAVFRI